MTTELGGLLLALASAAAINLGFLLQQRGLRSVSRTGPRELIAAALRSRAWLGGQALGWLGFAAQILAVSISPLALVQSFAAGGLVLSVPLASGLFGLRISRAQAVAVAVAGAALAALPIDLPAGADRIHPLPLIASLAALSLAGAAAGMRRSVTARAVAAGLLYGVADAAIKAISVHWAGGPVTALVSGWGALAAVATFGGFLTFQAALRSGSAVAAISLMNAAAALVALGCGLAGFGESVGKGTGPVALHLGAIALVLACVPWLAAAQERAAAEPGVSRDLARSYPARGSGSEGEQPGLQPRARTG